MLKDKLQYTLSTFTALSYSADWEAETQKMLSQGR